MARSSSPPRRRPGTRKPCAQLRLEPLERRELLAVVINTDDSGPGSLRQAIIDTNADPNDNTITFNIPGGGVQTISPTSALPEITEAITIDGYTQPEAVANTNSPDQGGSNAVLRIELNGAGAGGGVGGLDIRAGGSTVRGLVINRFGGQAILLRTGAGSIVEGNFLGIDPTGTTALPNLVGVQVDGLSPTDGNHVIGGTTAAARNVIVDGIAIFSNGNQVQGNLIGTNAAGTTALGSATTPSSASGIGITTADNNIIGGTTAAARNVISGNTDGVSISTGSTANVVQGNYIGTDVTGTAAVANANNGVRILGQSGNTIGGTAAGAGNLISGNGANGIEIDLDTATGNVIQGNRIGTNAAGTGPLGNGDNGIEFFADASNNTVGGTAAGAGNIIAFNTGNGVVVGSGTGNTISQNSIFDNTLLGIELDNFGNGVVTPNDLNDPDTGPNNLQNFPVLTFAAASATEVGIRGSLDSQPANTDFRIEFFASPTADPSGNGEGRTFIGAITATTQIGTLDAFFTAILPGDFRNMFITATATDPNGNTSEFSSSMEALECTLVVTNTSDSGEGSLRHAIDCANIFPGLDTITFNIPGAGVHTITPASALPFVSDPVVIDGYSQPGSSRNTLVNGNNAVLLVELDGTNAGVDANGLGSGGNNTSTTIQGLIINRFDRAGFSATGSNITIVGNFIGTDATGQNALGNRVGISFGEAEDVRIGGTDPADRNVISGNLENGINGGELADSLIQGNHIGVNAAGTAALPNGMHGIDLFFGRNNTIGGNATGGEGNLIGGNGAGGIALRDTTGNLVRGNFIGTDRARVLDLGNGGHGIEISGASDDNYIGGILDIGNTIAFNGGDGIRVAPDATASLILSNRIFSNDGLGINLVGPADPPSGVTLNDPGDGDAGPNGLQNTPVLTSAALNAGVVTITGTLNSTPGRTFTLQFFANDVPDPSGFHEGQTPIGSVDVTTDASGNASFSFTSPFSVNAGQIITATATDIAAEQTSEFTAQGVVVGGTPAEVADIAVTTFTDVPDPIAAGQDLTYTVVVTNNGPSPATNVVLTDFPLPANVQFVSTSAGTFDAANNRVVASLGNLAVGGTATVVIVVRPTAAAIGTTLFNTVGASANEFDPNLVNNQTQVTTTQVVAPTADTVGPTVVSLQRFGFHARPTRLVLTFNEALDPTRATDLANYRLTGPQGGVIGIRSAMYDPATRTVTLLPARLLNLHRTFRLIVSGTSASGVTDLAGNALDGDGDGRPGGDFTGRITRASLAEFPSRTVRAEVALSRRRPKAR